MEQQKTYRAIRHDIVRQKQAENSSEVHHPDEKINQIHKVLDGQLKDASILELFAGRGNCTRHYEKYGKVHCYDKKYLKTGDSFREYHRLIADNKIYDVIDLDPYGFPNRLFPDIYLLIENGFLFVTMPKPFVNIMNGITRTHMISYYDEHNPPLDKILETYVKWGLCHWREVQVIDVVDCNSIWRIALSVKKVKATEYTGVKNRPHEESVAPPSDNQLELF